MKKLLFILIVCGLFAACKKEQLQQYTEKPRIYLRLEKQAFYSLFPLASPGNLRVDYLPQNSSKKTDTLALTFQVSGPASSSPRPFSFERTENVGNGVEGVDFEWLDKDPVIPAGEYKKSLRLVIKRSLNMTKREVSFSYLLKSNEHFELGPKADTTSFSSNQSVMSLLAINFLAKDIAIKESNWDTFIAPYFGPYTEVRYRFIIDVLAKTSFPSNLQPSVMSSNRSKLRTALNKYNAAHPEKLKDENGNLITF
ncbi:DUF4843 domain-containing protein [Pedobacter gandavensis]|uniref:DUF4843 domain-containing protein n=1 Tax=Pedobacter gandavensis TaxID=2679963 RepID=UPI002931D87C|nr:DUF4843 domain-containing protein [Pedobacter gandavensis]